jgi:2-methylcitrate dehydratase PrpD
MAVALERSAAQRLARFAAGLSLADVPADVIDAAKLHLLDALACALAADALGEQRAPVELVVAAGGAEEATLVGRAERVPAQAAALANGALAHALDFDDTHAESVAHISAVVGPVALACAEAYGRDGETMLAAFVAGAETTIRLGAAASGEFHERGLHPTSVCGVFGATATAASLIGLDAGATADALGLAGSRAAGVLASLAEGVPVKPLHAGWAARDGVECARLAALGARGPRGVLEGHLGLFEALLGDGHAEALNAQVSDLGARWETPRIGFKPMPVCHFMHGVLEGAASLDVGAPSGIEEIEVAIDGAGVGLVLEPAAEKGRPVGSYDARFDLPWCVGAVLADGALTLAALRSPSDHAVALELASKVTYSVLADGDRSQFGGSIAVALRDGRRMEAVVSHPLGTTGAPMGADEVRAKARANAGGRAKALIAAVDSLDLHALRGAIVG